MRVDEHYIKVYGPFPVLMNKDGINIYTRLAKLMQVTK